MNLPGTDASTSRNALRELKRLDGTKYDVQVDFLLRSWPYATLRTALARLNARPLGPVQTLARAAVVRELERRQPRGSRVVTV